MLTANKFISKTKLLGRSQSITSVEAPLPQVDIDRFDKIAHKILKSVDVNDSQSRAVRWEL